MRKTNLTMILNGQGLHPPGAASGWRVAVVLTGSRPA